MREAFIAEIRSSPLRHGGAPLAKKARAALIGRLILRRY
jgi:hypothetical protein